MSENHMSASAFALRWQAAHTLEEAAAAVGITKTQASRRAASMRKRGAKLKCFRRPTLADLTVLDPETARTVLAGGDLTEAIEKVSEASADAHDDGGW